MFAQSDLVAAMLKTARKRSEKARKKKLKKARGKRSAARRNRQESYALKNA